MSDKTAVLILAAGLGKRLGGEQPKVLALARGRPLIDWLLGTVSQLRPERTVVVTGFGRERVEAHVRSMAALRALPCGDLFFAFQKRQLGTGDAVRAALPELVGFGGTVLVVPGDAPLVSAEALRGLLQQHHASKSVVSLLSFNAPTPNAYGRVVRDAASGNVVAIVEAKDCTPSEADIAEVNSSIYAVDSEFLGPAVQQLGNRNAQAEYYLTDIVSCAAAQGQRVSALLHSDNQQFQGVNTRLELLGVNMMMMQKDINDLIDKGVAVDDPGSLFIDPEVVVEPGARIGPCVQLRGKTVVRRNAVIEGSALLIDTVVEESALIRFGVRAESAVVGPQASVGPFAHLRPGTELGAEVKIGNFVETKNAHLARGAKASHLTYLGDATVGEDANVGAGTITCNYDGRKKHKTTIGAGAFIGSNSALVAPVEIEAGAYVGAGSVITKRVPAQSLAFTRAPMTIKEGWAKKKS